MKAISGLDLVGVCTANGSHARHAAEKFGFRYCATDERKIIEDPAINTVVIATRHHLHASQTLDCARAQARTFFAKNRSA